MIWKRILLIGLLLFIADFFVACCHCEDFPILEYKRCELRVFNMDTTISEYTASYSDSIKSESYRLSLNFLTNENTCSLKPTGLFVTSAMACSCDDQYGTPLDRVESIKVFTIQPFDSTHIAGADISDYMIVEGGAPSEIHISELIATLNDDRPNTYFNSQNFIVKLIATPDSAMARRFKVEATMTDGRILTENSPLTVLY